MNIVWKSGLGIVLFGLFAAGIGFLTGPQRPSALAGGPGSASAASPSAAQWAALQATLSTEIAARERLAAEVAELRARLDPLAGAGKPGADGVSALRPGAGPAGGGAAAGADGAGRGRENRRGPGGRRGGGAPLFDEERLVEAGLSTQDAEKLRERHDRAELELLALRDRAQREGVPGGGRALRQASEAVERQLREDLGEDMYDYMLFGAGRPNRLMVRDVLRGSAAETAGVQPGDLIVGYAGRRVFDPDELRRLTTQGKPGQPVALQVQRGDQIIDLSVPVGPIGAPLRPARRPPVRR